MSEIMRPISFGEIVARIQSEYKNSGSVFGIRANKFYRYADGAGFGIYDSRCESPLGPAAGPHTQLTPNIVAAYLAGARYMELKKIGRAHV
jgi:putative selenate reductase